MREQIEDILKANFRVDHCEVIDDSARHAGHAGAREGGNSHFKVMVVSGDFVGKSRIERHRMVNHALTSAFEQGMHALNINAKTPDEWQG
ncbi:MAG: BolA family transcriptional regulator [Rickettsiales bacterium]|nr:BolA family transcriptional regulator [Rickettsiales bacterium]